MQRPIEHSYCVLPWKIYAGEYAGDLKNPLEKVSRLVQFGITHFIDLTEEGELKPYAHLLPEKCIHNRFAIKDTNVPNKCDDVRKLLAYIMNVINNPNHKVYIHCWGGVGRTGTIVACLYEYLGEDFDMAMQHLHQSFSQCPKSQWRKSPENQVQIDFISTFGKFIKLHQGAPNTHISSYQREYTPELITSLSPNEVFVFGSNLKGMHHGGAAKAARIKFGAIYGQGFGLQGQSFAIPTMHGGVDAIRPYVDRFIAFARSNPHLKFYVTRIGCGIAGFRDEDIAPLFRASYSLPNVVLPQSFVKVIESL